MSERSKCQTVRAHIFGGEFYLYSDFATTMPGCRINLNKVDELNRWRWHKSGQTTEPFSVLLKHLEIKMILQNFRSAEKKSGRVYSAPNTEKGRPTKFKMLHSYHRPSRRSEQIRIVVYSEQGNHWCRETQSKIMPTESEWLARWPDKNCDHFPCEIVSLCFFPPLFTLPEDQIRFQISVQSKATLLMAHLFHIWRSS